MSRVGSRIGVSVLVLAVASLVAAGCGGGDDAATATPPATTPIPGATTPGSTVAGTTDPNCATDPNAAAGGTAPAAGAAPAASGDPAAAAAAASGGAAAGAAGCGDAAGSATVPDLDGSNVSGGLASVKGSSLFTPGAVSGEDLAQTETTSTETDPYDFGNVSNTTGTTTATTTSYSGAVMYVDGVSYSVNKNGSFPTSSPVFRLVSVSASDVEVELIAGQFTTGGGTGVFLDKGDLVSLVNSSELVTYKVKYLRPIVDTDGISF